jgi:hypothetical protein
MKGNFHVRFLEESGREIAPSYSARSNNGIMGIGESKKRMTIDNKLYRGSKFASIRKNADLLYGVLLHEWRNDL